jgi:hypothetical protein
MERRDAKIHVTTVANSREGKESYWSSRRDPIQFKQSYDRPANCGFSRKKRILGPTHQLVEMAGIKSVTPNASVPDKSDTAAKCDPLTKWATRAIFLLITLASFSWLDTIKVSFPPFFFLVALSLAGD